jgi:serine/tyrosine/threonine adenylyltransferase
MASDQPYRPDPQFLSIAADFADPVAAAAFPMQRLRHRNQRWAQAVGLGDLSEAEWLSHFAGFAPLPGNQPQPLAMRYHGHQFRNYNPDIGDGRGFLFAQVRDGAGRLLDLATKGSGQTPYSRFGDGRLTLKGGVREVLAASMLEALGVYTSKALSLVETGEALTRNDEPSPTRSSVLVRLSHSHIRFGTFQRAAFFERRDMLQALMRHVGEVYFPAILAEPEADQPAALLREVVIATARMCAQWMAAGFVHGVLNTDNMVVTGESFDYGPWRFLPASDPGFTAAYFDQTGLYAFGRQPEACGWNLAQLAGCLALIGDQAGLVEALEGYAPVYHRAIRTAMFARLGIEHGELEADLSFLQGLFGWMTDSGAAWAQFFHDWFCGAASAARAGASPQAGLYASAAFAPIRSVLEARTPVRPDRLDHAALQVPSPPTLVIEEVEALWTAIAERDDWGLLEDKLVAIEALRQGLALVPEAANTPP